MATNYDFGPFRLDVEERSLRCNGTPVKLTPKTFDLLLFLLEHPGHLVDRGTLLKAVWGGIHVDDAVLARAISDLRKALGQSGDQVWIETVPKFGYRLHAEVRAEEGSPPPSPVRRRSPILLVAGFLLLTLLILLVTGRTSDEGIHQLVVLPFQVIAQPAGSEALGVGLADALITRLGNLDGVIVRPLSAVRRFEKATVDPMQAARELQADATLEGTLQFNGDALRVRIRLIRASDGKAIWAETVDSPTDRLFDLEDRLASQVAAKLVLRLSEAQRRDLARAYEVDPQAHRLYVNGRYEWGKRTREGLEKAAELFRQAIDLSPRYGRAYAGLADSYLLLGGYGHHPQLEMLPKAKAIALKALELDSGLAEAHATLGLITQNLDWDWQEVERHYRAAIQLSPNYSTAHHWYAEFLSIQGRFDESRREFARARQIDPISPIIAVDQAQLYFFERQFDRSLELLDRAARDDPAFYLVHERKALIYLIQGNDEAAWREAMSLPECAGPDSDCRRIWTAWLPRRDPAAARAALPRLEAEARAGRVPAYAVMNAHLQQHNIPAALDWLERMFQSHGVWLITAKVNPVFDPLRSEPRARALLAKLHLDGH